MDTTRTYTSFGKRLAQVLEDMHLTVTQFAKQANMPVPSLHHVLYSTRNPSLATIAKIVEATQPFVNTDWLITGNLRPSTVVSRLLPMSSAPKDRGILMMTRTGIRYFGRYRRGFPTEPQPNLEAWRCDSAGNFSDPIGWYNLTLGEACEWQDLTAEY